MSSKPIPLNIDARIFPLFLLTFSQFYGVKDAYQPDERDKTPDQTFTQFITPIVGFLIVQKHRKSDFKARKLRKDSVGFLLQLIKLFFLVSRKFNGSFSLESLDVVKFCGNWIWTLVTHLKIVGTIFLLFETIGRKMIQ